MTGVFDFDARSLSGEPAPLDRYRGKVLLIVNTASHCGFTPQYAALEQLYRQYHARGFEILAFPCNQFGKQEPGSVDQIRAFCQTNYGVSFPMHAKIDVNGRHADPLFAYLTRQAPGLLGTRSIKWNFTKFLVKKDGSVHRRYAPFVRPQALAAAIERLLSQAPD